MYICKIFSCKFNIATCFHTKYTVQNRLCEIAKNSNIPKNAYYYESMTINSINIDDENEWLNSSKIYIAISF